MRPRAVAGGVFASASVLLIGWQIGAAQVSATTSTSTPATGSTSGSSGSASTGSGSTGSASGSTGTSSGSSASTATPSASATATPAAGSSVSGTFDGATTETRFGPVQVEIVVSAGKITDVVALQLTNEGGRSVEISNYAAPILRTEALSAQSAKIQSVSGATYTSEGYVTSLQSALDKAGL
ncbi:FMN-binding protein [Frondihabitans cladoniiphilus]|uniref:FMN-binding protein n=1 Tax=Frondihabitans cladoniiphilus TaxID=715785 RepID=UPI0031EBB289